MWLVYGASALHALFWISLNADPDSVVDRYERLMQQTAVSKHGKVYGWETLGSYWRDVGLHGITDAYEKALKAKINEN